MRPIANMSGKDRATDIGNVKKFGRPKDRSCVSVDILADRQTDLQTDILITILPNRSRGVELTCICDLGNTEGVLPSAGLSFKSRAAVRSMGVCTPDLSSSLFVKMHVKLEVVSKAASLEVEDQHGANNVHPSAFS